MADPLHVDNAEHDALTDEILWLLKERGAFDAGTVAAVGLSVISWAIRTAARDLGDGEAEGLRHRCREVIRRLEAKPLPEDVQ